VDVEAINTKTENKSDLERVARRLNPLKNTMNLKSIFKIFFILLVIVSACHVKKENNENHDINRLHDIWALFSL
jgi:hypothetical protein